MTRKIKNTLKYLLFLSVGIILFWWVYRDLEIELLKSEIRELNYGWIIASFMLGMFSHISRAIRWNMLIHPLGYRPRTLNSFLAVMVMYLTNMAIPRAGEVARCSVLTKYEDVPFSKLLGTVFVERIADVIALMFFAILIFLTQLGVISTFIETHPGMSDKVGGLFSLKNILIAVTGVIIIFVLFYIFRNNFKKTKIFKKVEEVLKNFAEGIKAITKMKRPWAFIGHTLFIYLMWLISLYFLFFSYEPTKGLGIFAGAAAFVMGGLAMIAPVQGGIGAWHFMVYETLFIYGIDKTEGKIFALVAHTTNNLSLMLVGLIALLLLPIVNKKR
ncbi:MAG: lysylphosphatidylglycerol synthase transmembrane domain-containing protein [Bacteroidota bacterium]